MRAPAVAVLCALPLSAAFGADTEILPSLRSRADRPELPRPAEIPSDAELEGAGVVIGTVSIDVGEVFDTDGPRERAALPRLANRLHIRTRPSTVESMLLFHAGERYSGRKLAESERILRTTRYLHDASVRPVAWHDGQVDIEVRTRDVWTLNPGLNFGRHGGENSSGFQVQELNLLGLGSQLSVGFTSGVDRSSTTMLYRDRQLFGSWWGLSLENSDNSDGRAREATLERPFFSFDTRWAAGVSVRDDARVDSLYNLGHIVDRFGVHERLATVYGGWSPGVSDAGDVHRWSAGFTVDDHRFEDAPGSALATFVPPDRKLAYPWIGYEWTQDRYSKTRNRDQIEKTEDFHLGWHFSSRLGYAAPTFGADRRAFMLSAQVDKGLELSERQTMQWSASFAGRMENGSLADSLMGVAGRYYLRQSPRRLLFMGLQVDRGVHLDPDRQLLLGGDNGLRGYPLRYQSGEGRWLFTLEQRGFTNWYPFRLFNVGGAAFVDVGRVWGDNPFGTAPQGLMKDIGFGLRLGNSRSALGNVLHIDVAFPLDGGRDLSKLQFLVETKRTF